MCSVSLVFYAVIGIPIGLVARHFHTFPKSYYGLGVISGDFGVFSPNNYLSFPDSGVDYYRHRAVIDQGALHIGAKDTFPDRRLPFLVEAVRLPLMLVAAIDFLRVAAAGIFPVCCQYPCTGRNTVGKRKINPMTTKTKIHLKAILNQSE